MQYFVSLDLDVDGSNFVLYLTSKARGRLLMATKVQMYTNSLGIQTQSGVAIKVFPHEDDSRVYIELSKK
jgi:hypothetical protein